MASPVLKLVAKDWALFAEDQLSEEVEEEGYDPTWEGGMTNCEFEDVGWVYMDLLNYVLLQGYLYQPQDWVGHYVRPPLMRFKDKFETGAGVLAEECERRPTSCGTTHSS